MINLLYGSMAAEDFLSFSAANVEGTIITKFDAHRWLTYERHDLCNHIITPFEQMYVDDAI